MTTCDDCGATMTVDRLTGDRACLRCARADATERLWRDGLAAARKALTR